MSHLDYYAYQAEARGVKTLEDVQRVASEKAYVYDRIVQPWLPRDKSGRLAEIACGHGSFLCWLSMRGYRNVTGIDSSAEQIELARQTGVTVAQMPSNNWFAAQPAASLQAIVAIDLIEHISKDDFMDFLRQTHRVLAPGGNLILRYPNGDSPLVGRNLFNDITHVWTYTTNCLETLGRMHGFSKFAFADESCHAIRDNRWLKVPVCKISTAVLAFLTRAATKEKVEFWSPNIWGCLER